MVNYLELFRPKSLDEYVGNKSQVIMVNKWFKAMNKPLLLIGPPGTGKTTLAYLMAKEHGFKVIGYNMSDRRLKEDIDEIVKSFKQSHLWNTIYVFDEVDGYGKLINKLLHKRVILIANDERRVKYVKDKCLVVRFSYPSEWERRELLERIIDRLGIEVDEDKKNDILSKSRTYRDVVLLAMLVVYGGETYSADLSDVRSMSVMARRALRGEIDTSYIKNVRELWIYMQFIKPEFVFTVHWPDWYKKKFLRFLSKQAV